MVLVLVVWFSSESVSAGLTITLRGGHGKSRKLNAFIDIGDAPKAGESMASEKTKPARGPSTVDSSPGEKLRMVDGIIDTPHESKAATL